MQMVNESIGNVVALGFKGKNSHPFFYECLIVILDRSKEITQFIKT